MTRIAVLQMDCSADQISQAHHLVAQAAAVGADFAVLPELAGCAWLPAAEEPALRAVAEPADGPTMQAFRAIAAEAKINLIAPIYEANGELGLSTAFLINRSGEIIGRYSKNHIPYERGWYEKFYYGPGNDGYPVFEHEGLRFGIQICWDNMFVEGTRTLALDGADVIFSPRATGVGSLPRWRSVLMGNAAVNHIYIATANRVGTDRGIQFGGGSLIAGPSGELCAAVEPGDAPGIVSFDVDPAALQRAREAEPYFENRRPELYTRLTRS